MNGETFIRGWNISHGDYISRVNEERPSFSRKWKKYLTRLMLTAGSMTLALIIYTAVKALAG